MKRDQAVCYAKSSKKAALTWATLAFFGGFAGVSAYGPIVTRLRESMEMSAFLMALLSSSPALTGSLMRIPFGAMVDRYGGKKPILILLGLAAAGILCITLLFWLFPSPDISQYPLFLLAGVLCGCGIAVFSVGIPTVSYWHSQEKQGSALAIYAGAGNLGPGVFALILPAMVVSFGFKTSYTIWFLFVLALVFLVAIFMKDAPYFQYRQMGIEIDKNALMNVCGEELFPSGKATESLKKAAADWRTWILTYLYFVSFGGFIALTVWFPTYWEEFFGFGLVAAGLLTALYSLSCSLLRILGGWASDRAGGETVALVSFLVTLAGSVVIAVAAGFHWLAAGGEVLMALGMGFANAAVFKLVPKYSPGAVGGAAGIVGGLGAFGGFAIPPLMGLFVKYYGPRGYSLGFLVFTALCVVSLLFFYILHRFAKTEKKSESD